MSPRSRTRRKPNVPARADRPAGTKRSLIRRVIASKAAGWALCIAVAVGHAFAIVKAPYQPETFLAVFPALVAAPGIVSMLLLRGQWRRWYRWAAILGLAMLTLGNPFVPLFVAAGTGWALHRGWFVERTGPLLAARRSTGQKPTKGKPAAKAA